MHNLVKFISKLVYFYAIEKSRNNDIFSCFFFFRFKEQNYTTFTRQYLNDRVALTFLSNFESDDVAAVQLGPNSTSLWMISPPDFERLKDDLKNNVTLLVRYKYSVSRVTYSEKMAGTVEAEQPFNLTAESPARKDLLAMLNQASVGKRIQLPFLFPKFLKVHFD